VVKLKAKKNITEVKRVPEVSTNIDEKLIYVLNKDTPTEHMLFAESIKTSLN